MPSGKLTYPRKREKKITIDSKVPAARGYVGSLEGKKKHYDAFCNCTFWLVCNLEIMEFDEDSGKLCKIKRHAAYLLLDVSLTSPTW